MSFGVRSTRLQAAVFACTPTPQKKMIKTFATGLTICCLMILSGCGQKSEPIDKGDAGKSATTGDTSGDSQPADAATDTADDPSATGSGSDTTEEGESTDQASQPAKSMYDATAFCYAAYEGNLAVVKKCLDDGLSVNTVGNEGLFVLGYAAHAGQPEVIKLLVEKGAKVNAFDSKGVTALYHAAGSESPAAVKALLDAGADVNSRNTNERFTPLMMAAMEGQLANVKLLLEAGADKSLQDADEDNASKFAADGGHTAIAELLQVDKAPEEK